MLTVFVAGAALVQDAAAAASPVRAVIRVALGLLIAVLFSYIVIEQIGTWLRRRSGRE